MKIACCVLPLQGWYVSSHPSYLQLLYSKSNTKFYLWRGYTILWRRVSLHHLFLHVLVVHLNYCINRGGVAFCYIHIYRYFSHCCTTIVLHLRVLRFTVSPVFLGIFINIISDECSTFTNCGKNFRSHPMLESFGVFELRR